jgi:predicted lactoylglutathione lyase
MSITVNTPTNDLKQSRAFYSALNFNVLSASAPVAFTDGKFIIEINPDRYSRAGLNMYKDSWSAEADLLKQKSVVHKTEDGYC